MSCWAGTRRHHHRTSSLAPHRHPNHPSACNRNPCIFLLRSHFESKFQLMEEPQRATPPKPVPPGRPGSKVSQIATIFQSMAPPPVKEVTDPPVPAAPITNNARNTAKTAEVVAADGAAPGVKTESHAARFNNARALFEKLGEQDTAPSPTKPAVPTKTDKLMANTLVARTVLRPTNGHPNGLDHEDQPLLPPKPAVPMVKPPKPEKPERKFSSRELIEKQRNWTAHFSKSRTTSPRTDKPPPPAKTPLLVPPLVPAPMLPPGEEKQEREVPEKKERVIVIAPLTPPPKTPPPSISPDMGPPPVSPTPSATESSADSQDAEKTLSELSEASPTTGPSSNDERCPDKVENNVLHQQQQTTILSSSLECQISNRNNEQPPLSYHHHPHHPHDTNMTHITSAPTTMMSPIRLEDTLTSSESEQKKVEFMSENYHVDLSPIRPIESEPSILQHRRRDDSESDREQGVCTPEIELRMRSPDSEKREREEEKGEVREDVAHLDKRKKVVVQLTLSSPDHPVPPSEFASPLLQEREYPDGEGSLSPTSPLERDEEEHASSIQKALDMEDVLYADAEEDETSEISASNSEEQLSSKDLLPDDDTIFLPKDLGPEEEDHIPSLPPRNIPERDRPPSLPPKDIPEELPPLPSKEVPEKLPPIPPKDLFESKDTPPPLPPKDIPEEPTPLPVTSRIAGSEPESMTPDEAENLLSARIIAKRQESLLSDEEAQEVHRLLSPPILETAPSANTEVAATDATEAVTEPVSEAVEENGTAPASPSLAEDSITAHSNSTLLEASLDYRDRADISLTMDGSLSAGSQSETESAGLLGSATSLTEPAEPAIDEGDANESCLSTPVACREVLVENGVHYLEDGHFWVEVPGLPESDDEDYDTDETIMVKQSSRVTFSTGPMRMYSTHSVGDYDRRNEEVDPVAASAEYELEKRVEKMDVFPVDLCKGPEGLGLSIIGMGVGADAGLEKLGIFVKTITEQGAAARDGRIQVNDQIIEVDGKSLVGVTQAYAASVLRNTSGLVHFLIGRERDPENSEVAQLIRQSLQADREREDHRRHQQDASPGEVASPSSAGETPAISEGSAPAPPPHRHPHYMSDLEAMRQLVKESQYKLAVADADIARLKARVAEQERQGGEEVAERLRQASGRLREMERGLQAAKKEVAAYQDMLEQSQGQHIALEKKYSKAKKLLREFQQREQDLLHREEFHLQLLQEKDTEYNALVKSLKDRIIQLEQELLETQRQAGLPSQLPYDGSSLRQLTPQMGRKQQAPPVKPLLQQLETELSDTEISDISPEDTDKTSTVERKMPVKEELDRAVPPHELLDISASKSKVELVKGGGLAGRQLPTPSKKGPNPGAPGGPFSSSGSDYGLDDSYLSTEEEESIKIITETTTASAERPGSLHVQQPLYQRTVFSSAHQELGFSSMQAVYVSRPVAPVSYAQQPRGPPPSLAEQLKQVLAERERRLSSGDHREEEHKPSTISQTLVEEIRQAVQEANARVKRVPLMSDSPSSRESPSPSSLSSSCSSVSPAMRPSSATDVRSTDPGSPETVWLSQEMLPTCTPGPPEKRPSGSHFWQSAPVSQWSKEQVCQWLLALGLEQHIPRFMEQNVAGPELLMLESREMKTLGVNGDDKNRLKRKLKELRIQEEKERKQADRERKERERLQRKAEKLAEKASKQRK